MAGIRRPGCFYAAGGVVALLLLLVLFVPNRLSSADTTPTNDAASATAAAAAALLSQQQSTPPPAAVVLQQQALLTVPPVTTVTTPAPLSNDEARLTIWTIMRDVKDATDPTFDSTAWMEHMHTYNAVNSWLQLGPRVDVLLFGTAASCAVTAAWQPSAAPASTVRCLPPPCINEDVHVPRYDCLFRDAAKLARTPFIMYSNSDMVYLDDLLAVLDTVRSLYPNFVVVGKRIDVTYTQQIDFAADWSRALRDFALTFGSQHGKYGIDYFLHRTASTLDMPPFIVGRVLWDNWLLAQYMADPKMATIDATEVLMALHLNHMKVGLSKFRNGTEINYRLAVSEYTSIDARHIGDIESTEYMLLPDPPAAGAAKTPLSIQAPRGGCPRCHIEQREPNLIVLLNKHAIDRTIVMATVNAGYLDMALNWLCSLQRVGVTNYMFHAVDRTIYDELRRRQLPVVYFESKMAASFRAQTVNSTNTGPVELDTKHLHVGQPLDYGTIEYQGIMNSRTELIFRVLHRGYHVLLCDIDVVLLRNPFTTLPPLFNLTLDVQGGAHKQAKITGGFVLLRATDTTRRLWATVLATHRIVFKAMQSAQRYNPHAMTEQAVLNEILRSPQYENATWSPIDERRIADGKRFFIDRLTLQNGEWPVAVHNNYVIGHTLKRQRFVNASLWLIEQDGACRPFPQFLPAQPRSPFRLSIRVLTFDRPAALQRLLGSIENEDFGTDRVPLHIFIDAPDADAVAADAGVVDRVAQTRATAERFTWRHGDKFVVVRSRHYGLIGQWLNAWFPTSPSEFALMLEDDNEMVRGFYAYLKRAAEHYFLTPGNYDARVYAFNVQHQRTIPGRYPTTPAELLPPGVRYYKFQGMSTWAPMFYSGLWSQFVSWYSEKQAVLEPLFSNLITNDWYVSRGRKIWSAWFIRWAAERGLYSINTNFDDAQSFVLNHRETGVNFNVTQGPNSKPIADVSAPFLQQLPPGPSLPLYDFHFNLIQDDPSVLEGRGLYADPSIITS